MSDTVVEARWLEGQRFGVVGESGVEVTVDGAKADGPSPMETLLIGLATCMGVDVVEILEKMRVPLQGLAARVEGDRRADPPRRYTAVRLTYEVDGVADADADKLQRAVDLSREKYCSVLHSLRSDIELSIRIEGG